MELAGKCVRAWEGSGTAAAILHLTIPALPLPQPQCDMKQLTPHCPTSDHAAPPRQQWAARPRAAADSGGGSSGPARLVLEPRQRGKLDMRADADFYSMPRYVHHLDANFRAQLTELYRQRIPEGTAVLDLCSSWSVVGWGGVGAWLPAAGAGADDGPGWLLLLRWCHTRCCHRCTAAGPLHDTGLGSKGQQSACVIRRG